MEGDFSRAGRPGKRPPVTHLPLCEFKWWVGLSDGDMGTIVKDWRLLFDSNVRSTEKGGRERGYSSYQLVRNTSYRAVTSSDYM